MYYTLHHHIWSFVSGMSSIQWINFSNSNEVLFNKNNYIVARWKLH